MPSPDLATHPHHLHPHAVRIWNYIFLMRMLGVLYAFAALMVLFFSPEIVNAVNYLPRILHVGASLPPLAEHLWTTLAGSGLAGLSLLCFLASADPYQRGYAFVHLLIKAVTASVLTLYFLNDQPYLMYAIVAFLNAMVFLSAGWGLLRLGRRPKPPAPPLTQPIDEPKCT